MNKKKLIDFLKDNTNPLLENKLKELLLKDKCDYKELHKTYNDILDHTFSLLEDVSVLPDGNIIIHNNE